MSPLPESIFKLLDTDARLGPDREAKALSESEVRTQTEAAINGAGIKGTTAELVKSATLFMHDHLDASHTISQDITSASGSMLHGLMHRREPDYGNARYWWSRTGNHPCFDTLAERTTELLTNEGATDLLNQLLSDDAWDSSGMVDAISDAESGRTNSTTYDLLKKIQKLEIITLLEQELG
ncbi:hypothetical protein N9B94_02910 [Verrucomicrobia bacterium]|nr:hypothetical protein [Verrucomicrobiota bacterium]